jgi:hypothetical protein
VLDKIIGDIQEYGWEGAVFPMIIIGGFIGIGLIVAYTFYGSAE